MIQALPLFFFHIPKTAGSSLRESFYGVYGDYIAPVDFMSAKDIFRKYPHSPSFQGHAQLFPGEFDQIKASFITTTVLRDPIDRLISQYFQYRRAGSAVNPTEAAATRLPLNDYLQWLIDNQDINEGNKICSSLATLRSPQTHKLGERSTFHYAQEALSQFDLVGTTQRLDEYLKALGELCHCEFPAIRRVNTSTANERAEVNDTSRELAAKVCFLDRKLVSSAFHGQNFLIQERKHPLEPRNLSFGLLDFGTKIAYIANFAISPNPSPGLVLDIRAKELVWGITVGYAIKSSAGETLHGSNSLIEGRRIDLIPGNNQVTLKLPASIPPGEYEISASIHRGVTHLEGCLQWLDPAAKIRVANDGSITVVDGISQRNEASLQERASNRVL